MANTKAAMEYAQTFEREPMEKRLSELDLKAPTLVDVVVRHEQEIQELKRLITPLMEFKQEQPTTMGMEYAANFEKAEKLLEKKEWVGLTEDEIEELPREQAWWGVIRAVEALLKEKNT